MSEITLKTKSYEESPGVASSGRVVFLAMASTAIVQILCGCYALVFETSIPLASAAWAAGIGTLTTAYSFKRDAKRQEIAESLAEAEANKA